MLSDAPSSRAARDSSHHEDRARQATDFGGFFDARAAFTPLVAGATVTSITGALAMHFDVRGAWIALALSALVGSIFLFDSKVPHRALRVVLFILNTLTIFTTAVGLNSAGAAAFSSAEDEPAELAPRGGDARGAAGRSFFHDWFGD